MNTSMGPPTFSLCSMHPSFSRRHYGARYLSFTASWLSTRFRQGGEGRLGAFHRFVRSTGGILGSLFSILNPLSGFRHSWWFENALLRYRSWYCQGALTTFESVIVYQTYCAGNFSNASRRTYHGRDIVLAQTIPGKEAWWHQPSIRSRSQEHSRTSLREASPMLDGDLEAQHEIFLGVSLFASITSLSRTETRYSFS